MGTFCWYVSLSPSSQIKFFCCLHLYDGKNLSVPIDGTSSGDFLWICNNYCFRRNLNFFPLTKTVFGRRKGQVMDAFCGYVSPPSKQIYVCNAQSIIHQYPASSFCNQRKITIESWGWGMRWNSKVPNQNHLPWKPFALKFDLFSTRG